MQNKLQELTDKLYNEGLSKGKQEGEAFLEQAKKEAENIVSNARKEAEAIIEKARREAEDLKVKTGGDLKMAASQSIAATRQDIENLIVAKITDKEVKASMSSAEFIKGIITEVAKGFNADDPKELELVLPESLKKELEPFVQTELAGILKTDVSASFSKKISGGFNIGPKDGGYFISFTDETFKELISEYLRPATRKILFGK
ncbi:MAG: hypothetical protein OSJ55_02535 [Bacteroidales bacterium]|nr:hypothetical protein [Bacteroidales bacterium]